MPSSINSTSSSPGGLVSAGDTDNELVIQTDDTTAISIDASQNVTITGDLAVGGVVLTANGSVSNPSFSASGDTNTGIFFPAADTIAFAEGGAEAMRIDSSGNVGIGTTSPASKLDISTGGSTGTTDMVTLSGLDAGSAKQTYGVIRMGIENNTAGAEQGNMHLQTVESGTVRDRIFMKGGGEIGFYNGGTERARITSGGDLQFNSGYGSVATAYGCRAWVNFNGTGTVAIRASGNVSSITDLGTGLYQINFTSAMPDANYAATVAGAADRDAGGGNSSFNIRAPSTNYIGSASVTTGSVQVSLKNQSGTLNDSDVVTVSIFR
jgi:hypothetical protein